MSRGQPSSDKNKQHQQWKGKQTQKTKDFKGTLKRLVDNIKPYKVQLSAVFAAAVLSTVFTILSPAIMGRATTALFQGVRGDGIDFGYIMRILFVLGGLYLFSALFKYLQQYIMAGVAQKIVYGLRKEVDEKLARLPLPFFDRHNHGDIMSRTVNDLENISNTLQRSLTQLITSAVTLLGITVMMLIINPWMALVVLLTLPASYLVTRKIAARSKQYFSKQRKALGELNSYVEEMYTGHEVIKAFGHEPLSISEFNRKNENLYESGWKAQFISGVMMPLTRFINNIGYVLVCVVGGMFVMNGTIHVGDIQAFIQYARQFSQPITRTANIANILQSTIASAERVFEILDETEETPDTANASVIASPKGHMTFQNVQFSYQQGEPLINDLNIRVKQGQTVAIVGPTGAGKTTLINLLMRFYEMDSGEITIDGTDIRDLKRSHLRSLFGMVLQDTWLFHGTIRDNIAYGNDHVTDDEIVQAARTAHADRFIRTLPKGYDTPLNEEAGNISQGQKQLLTLARAVLAHPAFLILDEATSSVDTRTEIHIQQAMNELMKGKTSFIIAHRLSTVRDADVILVMDRGNIVEQGSHDELLAKGGFYADLYEQQFSGQSYETVS